MAEENVLKIPLNGKQIDYITRILNSIRFLISLTKIEKSSFSKSLE